MTVKRLIEILSARDPDATVFLGDSTDPRGDKLAWECEGVLGGPGDKDVVLEHARNQKHVAFLT